MYQIDEYYLMHKNIKVAKFSMNEIGNQIKVIEIYNKKHSHHKCWNSIRWIIEIPRCKNYLIIVLPRVIRRCFCEI